MTPFPRPRGFWIFELPNLVFGAFAMVFIAPLVLGMFWVQARERIGWADVALASASAVLLVLFIMIIFFLRGEKARYTVQPNWLRCLVAGVGLAIILGATCADTYLLHRSKFTSTRLCEDGVTVLIITAVLGFLKQNRSKRQLS
jgi:hypothetical protein